MKQVAKRAATISAMIGILLNSVFPQFNTLTDTKTTRKGSEAVYKESGRGFPSGLSISRSVQNGTSVLGATPTLNETQRVTSDEYRVNKRLGRSVAIDGNTAVVGDSYDEATGGVVYVYTRSNFVWRQQAKLRPNDMLFSQSLFGHSVDIEGDVIVIGSEGHEAGRGAAYIFVRSGTIWTQQAKLTASDRAAGDKFGADVALSGSTLLLGAPDDDDAGEDSGSAYVFTRDIRGTWTQQTKLKDRNGAADDQFGISVALDLNTAVVGSFFDDNNGDKQGSVFVFVRNNSTWSQQAKLVDDDAQIQNRLGTSVAVDGNTILAGARDSAYVFTRNVNAWTEQAILTPDDGADFNFGSRVAIDEDTALVGSTRDDDGAPDSGAAYVFTRSGRDWSQETKLKPAVPKPSYRFGSSVAIDRSTAIVGAPSFNAIADLGGESHIYTRRGVWSQQALLRPNGGSANDEFGHKVAIEGDVALVSAHRFDRPYAPENLGAVFVFYRFESVWYSLQKYSNQNDIEFGSSVDISGNNAIVGTASRNGASIYSVPYNTTSLPLEGLSGANLNPGSNFGASVSISGFTAVVGAPGNEHDGVVSGAAFVFVRTSGNNWSLEAKLTPNDGQENDGFGSSVSIDGEKVVVGAPQEDENGADSGAAYVYTRSNTIWTQQAKITAGDGASLDEFAKEIQIRGDTIVAGAAGDDDLGDSSGAAYVFTGVGPNWTEQTKLKARDASAGDKFGSSVDYENDRIAVGSPGDDDGGPESGSSYVFVRSGSNWFEQKKLVGSDSSGGMGRSIAMSGDTIITGAPLSNVNELVANPSNFFGDAQGASYIFEVPNEPLVPTGTRFDFDGDSKADASIFRPGVGEWWYLRSSDGGNYATQFGASSDILVPADYTGDGRTDIAFFRPATAEWFVLRSEDESFFSFPFGANGDIPAPGDFDGDGIDDPAVFRPSTATWFILRSSDAQVGFVGFGADGDKPTIGDFDGDGTDDIAVYRPSSSEWWQLRSSQGVFAVQFGAAGDRTVSADFTGDGADDIAFWRPSNGSWFVLRSEDNSFFSFPFGATGDIPAPADYDGDGTADPTVFRPSNATWFSLQSTAGTIATGFGAAGDTPVPGAFVVE